MSINKDIIALDDHEHILLRPEIYVGSVVQTEERVFIFNNNELTIETRNYSIGM